MAWTSPMTAVANSVYTAAQFNTHVRDNLLETAPAKAATPGSHFVTSGTNSISERTMDSNRVDAGESTSSTSWGNLSTAGPSVTVDTGTQALVFITARFRNTSGTGVGSMGYEISGATTQSPTTSHALRFFESSFHRATTVEYEDSLTAGSNTFTAKYIAGSSSTAEFANRTLIVIPY